MTTIAIHVYFDHFCLYFRLLWQLWLSVDLGQCLAQGKTTDGCHCEAAAALSMTSPTFITYACSHQMCCAIYCTLFSLFVCLSVCLSVVRPLCWADWPLSCNLPTAPLNSLHLLLRYHFCHVFHVLHYNWCCKKQFCFVKQWTCCDCDSRPCTLHLLCMHCLHAVCWYYYTILYDVFTCYNVLWWYNIILKVYTVLSYWLCTSHVHQEQSLVTHVVWPLPYTRVLHIQGVTLVNL